MAGDAVLSQFQQVDKSGPSIDTSRKLKVGIIGTGWIAESHIESYARRRNCGGRRSG